MDFRLVLGLWAASVAPLGILIGLRRDTDRALLWTIRWGLVLLLFTPFVITVDTVFPFIVGKALVSRGIIEIVFGMWVVLAVRNPGFRPRRSWATVLFAAFLLASLATAFTGSSFTRSFWSNFERMQGVFDLAHWFALFVVVLNVVRGARQWRALFSAIVGLGLVSALIAVAQRFDVGLISVVTRADRVSGTLGNPTYLGGYMAVVAMLALGLLADSLARRSRTPAVEPPPDQPAGGGGLRQAVTAIAAESPERVVIWPVVYGGIWMIVGPSIASGANAVIVALSAIGASAWVTMVLLTGRERLLWAITAGFAIWVLVETGSRGAAGALAAGLVATAIVYAIRAGDRRSRVVAGTLAGLVVALGLVFAVARDTGVVQRVAGTTTLTERMFAGSASVDHARAVSARTAFEGWQDRPVTGWGPENFAVVFWLYQRASDFDEPPLSHDQAHSKPLDVLATTGLAGFLPYMGLWIALFWLAVVHVRRNRAALHLNAFLCGTLVAYFVHLLFLFETANTLLLFAMLAAWAASAEPEQSRAGVRSAMQPASLSRPGAWRVRRAYAVQYGVPAITATALVLAFFAIHYRVYRAAFLIIRAIPLHRVEAVLNTFSPLGTIGRVGYADTMATRLTSLAPGERAVAISVLSAELDKAIANEPENLLLRVSASRFFAAATPFRPGLITRARLEMEEALRLGPSTHEAQARAVEQAFLERDIDAVLLAVSMWRASHPALGTLYDERVRELAEQLKRERAGGT